MPHQSNPDKFDRFTKRVTRMLVGLFVAGIALTATSYYLSDQQVADQQRSRIEITYESCIDQNQRNEKGVQGALKQGRPKAVELINVIIPHRDCRALIQERFGADAEIPAD